MRTLQQRVQKSVNCEMVCTNSKGKVVKAILEVEGACLNLETSHREPHRKEDPPDHPVMHGMIAYAAELINRFKIINKKLTPREAIRGKHTSMRMAEFGKNVLWLPETCESGRMEKLEPKFEQVVWLGVCPRTNEAIVVAFSGIVRAGTVKRQAIEDAWTSTSLISVSVSNTPWTIGRQSKRHELTFEDDEVEKVIKVDESELPVTRGSSGSPRRISRGSGTQTAAWAATQCDKAS